MALTYAHSDGADGVRPQRHRRGDDDDRVRHRDRRRLRARRDARGRDPRGRPRGRQHVYMHDVLSTRLSIRMRGSSLGHHQAIEKDERFYELAPPAGRQPRLDARRDGRRARLLRRELDRRRRRRRQRDAASPRTWSASAAWAPSRSRLNGEFRGTDEERDEAEERYMQRFERIGMQIMNRAQAGAMMGDADRRRSSATRSRRPPRRGSSARPTSPRVCLIAPQPRGRARRSPTSSCERARAVRRRGRRASSRPPTSRRRDIDITDETIWPKL